ncbi:MAG: hypothetical protein WCD69_26835 [Xanthobacteraceae bacterium]
MDRSDDSLEKINDQRDQLEGKTLQHDRDANKQTRAAIFPL